VQGSNSLAIQMLAIPGAGRTRNWPLRFISEYRTTVKDDMPFPLSEHEIVAREAIDDRNNCELFTVRALPFLIPNRWL